MWFRWKKIENEYLIYLINFLYFLIEKVSRPCFMSMIITSVFPSPFLHRDLNFGFISVTDKVHCELFTYVHIRDERKRTQIWKQTRTQTKSWVRIHDFKFMVKQRLIEHGLWQTSDTHVRPFLADIHPRILGPRTRIYRSTNFKNFSLNSGFGIGSRRWNWKFRENHFWNPNPELLLHSSYSSWP